MTAEAGAGTDGQGGDESALEAAADPSAVAVVAAEPQADPAGAPAGPTGPAFAVPAPLAAVWRRWSAGNPKVLYAALAMIVIQLAVREAFLNHLYFIQDDFDFQNQAATQGLGWTYLMHIHANHLMPGSLLIAWAVTRISPLNWALTSASVLLMQLVASLAVLRMLRVLFGTRPAILLPFAVYAFGAVNIAATSWWAAALQLLPLQAVVAAAVASHVEYLRGGGRRHLLAEVVYVLLGLSFIGKGAVIPVLLGVLTICYFTSQTSFSRALIETVRRHWALWAGYIVLLIGYESLYRARLHAEHVVVPRIDSVSNIWDFTWRLIVDTFGTTVVGGPWQWYTVPDSNALALPPTALVRLAWLLLAALIAASVVFRRGAVRAWWILLGYVLVGDVIPTLIGRMGSSQAVYIPLAAMETHYVADAAPVLALCLGLAFLPLAGETDAYRRPLPSDPRFQGLSQALVGGVAVLASVGLVVSTVQYYRGVNGRVSRTFVSNAQAELRSGTDGSKILDTYVDPRLMVPWVAPANYTSWVLGAVATPAQRKAMRTSAPLDTDALAFDPDGRLRRVKELRLDSPVWPFKGSSAPSGPTSFGYCFGGDPVKGFPTPAPFVDVVLDAKVDWKHWMVQFSYIDGEDSDLTIQSGYSVRTLHLPAKQHVVTLMMDPNGDTFRFSGATSHNAMCISSLVVGFPVFD